MRTVLEYFEPAIQSEIEVMLKFVQTDKSVYVHAQEAHPSNHLILSGSQLLRWMRKTVNCTSFASSLVVTATPGFGMRTGARRRTGLR
jgi:hypothetical protein